VSANSETTVGAAYASYSADLALRNRFDCRHATTWVNLMIYLLNNIAIGDLNRNTT
jgi:hypothetical protein